MSNYNLSPELQREIWAQIQRGVDSARELGVLAEMPMLVRIEHSDGRTETIFRWHEPVDTPHP